MQIKSPVRYHFILRMTIIKRRHTTTNVGEYAEKMETSYIAGGNVRWAQPLWENNLAASQNVKYKTILLPAIPLLGIHARGMETSVHTKTCMQLFIATLFISAPNWNNLCVRQQVNGQAKPGVSK